MIFPKYSSSAAQADPESPELELEKVMRQESGW